MSQRTWCEDGTLQRHLRTLRNLKCYKDLSVCSSRSVFMWDHRQRTVAADCEFKSDPWNYSRLYAAELISSYTVTRYRQSCHHNILTFWLVTLKVAHQFDVLFDAFKAFQFSAVINNFHRILENLREKRSGREEKRKPRWEYLLGISM